MKQQKNPKICIRRHKDEPRRLVAKYVEHGKELQKTFYIWRWRPSDIAALEKFVSEWVDQMKHADCAPSENHRQLALNSAGTILMGIREFKEAANRRAQGKRRTVDGRCCRNSIDESGSTFAKDIAHHCFAIKSRLYNLQRRMRLSEWNYIKGQVESVLYHVESQRPK